MIGGRKTTKTPTQKFSHPNPRRKRGRRDREQLRHPPKTTTKTPTQKFFNSYCGSISCKPDIVYTRPGETKVSGIIEVKTGSGPNSPQQSSIYPQINSGDAIPTGDLARQLNLRPGMPLEQLRHPPKNSVIPILI